MTFAMAVLCTTATVCLVDVSLAVTCGEADIGLADFRAGTLTASSPSIPLQCTAINLTECSVGDAGVSALAEALKSHPAVVAVFLGRNSFGPIGASSLAEAIKVNNIMTRLDISKNLITKKGAAFLADAFKVNTAVTSVDMSSCVIGNDGVIALAEALKVNTVITKMNLRQNGIGIHGFRALAGAFMLNTAITSVELDYNRFAGIYAGELFRFNNIITSVHLQGTEISDESAANLADVFKENTAINFVDLSNNAITSVGAALLGDALKVNRGIAVVDLSGNSIGDAGAASLAEALLVNTGITTMDLSDNRIRSAQVDAVAWLVDNAAIRSVAECGGSGILVQPSGQCQCSGLARLGSGPFCSERPVCFAEDIGLSADHKGEKGGLVIPLRCRILDLGSSNITEAGFGRLAEALKGNAVVSAVDLSNNFISTEAVTLLAEAFAASSVIASVDLSANLGIFGSASAIVLANALANNSAITSINLNGNFFDSLGAIALATAFKVNSVITSVQLSGNILGNIGASALAAAIKVNNFITFLDLSRNQINSGGIELLADALEMNSAIVTLDLSVNGFGNNGAKSLGKAFQTNTVISSVNLSGNTFGDAGAVALAESFTVNEAITSVDLSDNEFGDAGAVAFAEAFRGNTVVTTVVLSNNRFGTAGFAALADSLKVNGAISNLGLGGIGIDFEDAVALKNAFMVNKAITTVNLENNHLTDADMIVLAKAFKVNFAITTIDLSNNLIGNAGMASFANALTTNTAITALDASNNMIGAAWLAAIAWLVDNAASRSVAECSGSGIIVQPSGQCQCSGLALLGTGPSCSVVVCVATDIGLVEFQAGEVAALAIPKRCIALHLSNSGVTNSGAIGLASALEIRMSVTEVDLSNNLIGDAGIARLDAVLKANTNITTINLLGNRQGDSLVSPLACPNASSAADPACSGTPDTDKQPPIRFGVVGAVITAFASAVGVSVALLYFSRRSQRRGHAPASNKLTSKFVAVARAHAEARFVIEYRQLVTAKSMSEFQLELIKLEVPRTTVEVGAELGRGQSGVVFRGTFSSNRGVNLAIKTRADGSVVVGGTAAVADEALILEAILLNGLRHPAIITLLAMVTTGAPVLVCTELMEHGDLRDFLRASRPSARTGHGTRPVEISQRVMTVMVANLGSAMAFLEQHSIIHRDIAARNVLVGMHATDVKLADLGAARNVHRTCQLAADGIYKATTDHSPARWMALEALREAKFSHKSDVFAFGVLIWEILSLGRTPWGAFGVPEFTQALADGKRLAFPVELAQDSHDVAPGALTLYAIAIRCWRDCPTKRPHFHQLESEFAVYHTVLEVGGGTVPNKTPADEWHSQACGRPNDTVVEGHGEINQMPPARDADGCIADTGAAKRETLDADGYVADTAAGQSQATDIDMQVADPSSPPRKGIGARTARKASLYLGFEETSSSGGLNDDETRL
jgi:Ran GTPase-activating protein (RanGAP) involved in mRNA processing and transport